MKCKYGALLNDADRRKLKRSEQNLTKTNPTTGLGSNWAPAFTRVGTLIMATIYLQLIQN